jgi:4-alpha-glucanotransferase
MDRLRERAAAWGIDTEYRDGFGRRRKVKPRVVSRLLAAVSAEREASVRLLPRTIVVRGEARPSLDVRRVDVRRVDVAAPDGAALRWEIFSDREIAAGGATSPGLTSPGLMLPRELPTGLLRLRVTAAQGGATEEASLIVCPQRAYQGAETMARRMWGIAAQLYGVRSARNWGHGDFTDLLALIDLAAELGASAVGLNPLHALFDDRPSEPSPYFPNSRLFLNPLYIDLDAVPEFPGLRPAGLEQSVERLRNTSMVDYPAVAEAKRLALELAYGNFLETSTPERRKAFDRFRRSRGPALARFACFEVLRRKLDAPWWEWPPAWREADQTALDGLQRTEQRDVGFVEFVQWLAHEQLDRCRSRARERRLAIGLYLDVAVGVRRDGFDAWSDRSSILPGLTVGAPPDALNRSGQDWGLAAFNPVALEDRQFEPYVRMLRASMQYAGAIRLDHVLGLKRLFLVPDGLSPADGAYIRFPFEALLAVTALSSVEARCIVIGEDLGTVPEGFRETLADWGLWSYQVMLFERSRSGDFRPPEDYREDALVTFATHDLPTYAGWRDGRDLAVKRGLGLATGETRQQRQAAFDALERAVTQSAGERADFAAVAGFLTSTRSRLLIVSMEDLLGESDQVNVPGTIDSYPNWRRRLPVTLEDLTRQEGVMAIANGMRVAQRSPPTGR